VVTITKPAPDATLDANTVVQWTTSDIDGDDVGAAVQYSANGLTWNTIQADTSDDPVLLSPNRLPSSTSAILRVLVTDGVNTSVESVTGLTLGPSRLPSVAISHPHHAEEYRASTNVIRHGTAVDP